MKQRVVEVVKVPVPEGTTVDLSLEQAAAALGMHVRSLQRKMRAGAIGYYRGTSRPTFSTAHLDAYRQQHEVQPMKKRLSR